MKQEESDLIEEVRKLRTLVEQYPNQFPHLFNPRKQFVSTLLLGIARGIGFMIAFTLVIPLLVFFLRQIEWIPLIGELVGKIAERVLDIQ